MSARPDPCLSAACACLLTALVHLAVLPAPVRAQELMAPADAPQSSLRVADYEAGTYVAPPVEAGKHAGRVAMNIEVTYVGFPPEAQAAFAFAADLWEQFLTSPVTVRVQATWAALDEDVLGSAGPRLVANFSGAPSPNIWYPTALAESIVGVNLSGTGVDIEATFNSTFDSWYFGVDGAPPSGTFDFVTVVLHELGHGLGFTGSFEVDDGDAANGDECPEGAAGSGCWGLGSQEYPIVYDLFTEDIGGVALLSYPTPSDVLGDVLQSGQVFFDGDAARGANEVPVDLYAPANFEAGSSYAHLDEERFPAGDLNSLMTPRLARSEAIHSPGAVTCGIFQDIGWTMGEGCLVLLDDATDVELSPLPEEPALTGLYPNPAATEATVVIRPGTARTLTVELYDVIGRRVARLHEGAVPGATLQLRLPVEALPAGVYLLRLTGDGTVATRRLVVAR